MLSTSRSVLCAPQTYKTTDPYKRQSASAVPKIRVTLSDPNHIPIRQHLCAKNAAKLAILCKRSSRRKRMSRNALETCHESAKTTTPLDSPALSRPKPGALARRKEPMESLPPSWLAALVLKTTKIITSKNNTSNSGDRSLAHANIGQERGFTEVNTCDSNRLPPLWPKKRSGQA